MSSCPRPARRIVLTALLALAVVAGVVEPAVADPAPTAPTAPPDPTKAPPVKDRSAEGADTGAASAADAPTWDVDSQGSFSDTLPITVPAFRALAPNLALHYDSSVGNGWAGVGWNLAGVSRIERGNDRKGTPRYDAGDGFYLDGEPLVACAPGSVSPSCTTGGTHSTRTESYTRIALTGSGADSRWTITAKDGSRRVYAPVYSPSTGTVFRWGISTAVDTRGNTVDYTWSDDEFGGRWDHPTSISYNGTVVRFRWEARPDTMSSATGAAALTTATGRLKTIDVSVDGARVRAYALTYTASADSGRSLLAKVQQYGRDAVLDDSGTVTGGTALPAMTQKYAAGTAGFVAGATDAITNHVDDKTFSMDIDGDGRTDMLELAPGATYQLKTWLSTGTSYRLASQTGGPAYSSASRFLTGDFSGDGKADLLEIFPYGLSRGRRLWVSTGTGFTAAPVDYLAQAGDSSRFLAAELNGDGRTDMIELRQCGYLSLQYCRTSWLATGTGFTAGATDDLIGLNDHRQFLTLDVNGDGRQDMVDIYVGGFQVAQRRVWLSTGSGFVLADTDTGMGWSDPDANGNGSRFLTLDVNGDDRDDMVELFPGFGRYTRRTWLSTGRGFVLGATDTDMVSAGAAAQVVADVNADGRGDMIEVAPAAFGAPQRRVWLSTGSGFRAGATDSGMAAYSCSKGTCSSQFVEADVDGDGLVEMVETFSADFGFSKKRRIWRIGGAVPDLLTSRTNEWGGTTSVGYAPSSKWTSDNNPPLRQTATSVTADDGRRAPATTAFSYADGHYDWAGQRSVGYKTVRRTEPCNAGETACPYTTTRYRQDFGAALKPERVEQHAGSDALLRATDTEYDTNGATMPWTATVAGVRQTDYAGSGADCPGSQCRRTYTTTTVNAYGETTRSVEQGDADRAGDERTTTTTFVPNTTTYVVAAPAEVRVTEGTSGTGQLLSRTRTSYDGAASWDTAPTDGLVTAKASWLSTTDTDLRRTAAYDSTGNVIARTDELGARSTIAYDTTHHLYPVAETNPLGQTTTRSWNFGCGQPATETDLNAQDTTYTYDALCRPVEQAGPGTRLQRWTRSNLGDPAAQYEQVTRRVDGTHEMWSRTYLDGWHRTWRKADSGPDAATGDSYVDTEFTPRAGKVASTTQPYYRVAGQPQPTTYATTTAYDALDRPTRTTYADGAASSKSYGAWTVTSTDENGHATTDRMNAYGKRVASEQTRDGKASNATYEFNLRDQLVRSTDPLGHAITYTPDSLGRNASMTDPSWGTWTYEWDAAGRMTAQTDALGQRTTFLYDALGRRVDRTSRAGTLGATSVKWRYDEVRDGRANVGKLTGVVDAAGTKLNDYDAQGRLVHTVRSIGGTPFEYRYGFDDADHPIWTTYPDGDTLGTAADPIRYDGAGRVSAIPGYVTAARYDAAGKLVRIENANGTVTTRPYDPKRERLNGIVTKTATATIQDSVFTRDPKGMITAVASSRAQDVRSYAHDEGDQVTAITSDQGKQTLTYDAAGNITSNSRLGAYAYASANPNAVTQAGPNTYAYDKTGKMTSGAGRTLTWDGDNRLASVTRAGVTTTFTYDADGLRMQQAAGTDVRRYPSADVEVDGAGTYTKYVALTGVPVARKDGATKTWLHTDQVGTIVARTGVTGTELDRRTYTAHGAVLSGPAPDGTRGFTGKQQDATGLVYMNARYYDPELGRFISPDPTIDGEANIGLNRYAYAANNPADNSDPTGLSCDKGSKNCDDKNPNDGYLAGLFRFVASNVIDSVARFPVMSVLSAAKTGWAQFQADRDMIYGPLPGITPVKDEGIKLTLAVGDGLLTAGKSFLEGKGDGLTKGFYGAWKYQRDLKQYNDTIEANKGRPADQQVDPGEKPLEVVPLLGQIEGCEGPLLC